MALAAVKRPAPMKTKMITLTGDFEEYAFVARVNPPVSLIKEISSDDLDRIAGALASVIVEWNFPTADGEGVLPLGADSILGLDYDLMKETSKAFGEAFRESAGVPVPKS